MTWQAIQTTYLFEKYLNDAVYEMFNTCSWKELNRSVFLLVKYHSPENLNFQHVPIEEKNNNLYMKNRLEKTNTSRKGSIIDALNSFDIVEIFNCGGVFLEIYERVLCQNMQYNLYTEPVKDIVAKRDLYKKQVTDLQHTLVKKPLTRYMVERTGARRMIKINAQQGSGRERILTGWLKNADLRGTII